MNNLERKTFGLTVKNVNEEAGTFTGLLSVYGVVDEYGDVVERGAYTKTLQENGGSLPLLWQHNQELPIGKLQVLDGEDGLEVSGKLVLDDNVPQAKTAYALLKAGVVGGLSIGFRTVRKKMEGNIRKLKEIKLFEGSLVTIPANRFALVSAVKAAGHGESKDFLSELEQIQVFDTFYQLMAALRYALYEITMNSDLGDDEKESAAAEAIDQFRAAFVGFVQRFNALEDKPGYLSAEQLVEKLKKADDPVSETLTEFCKKFLEPEHPGTSEQSDAASAAPIEEKAIDGEQALQSWLTDAIKGWESQLEKAA